MPKPSRLKRPWLNAAFALLIIGALATAAGVYVSMQRIVAYAEVRAERETAGEHQAYLSEVESVNLPALVGATVGAISLVGSLVCLAIHRRRSRLRRMPESQVGRSSV